MVFWNKGYYVIYPVYNFSNKTLSHDSNYIMDVVTWPKLVTLASVQEKLSWPQFYKDLTRKTAFFEERSWFKFNNLGLALGINLKFYTSLPKGSKLKVRKFWGLIFFAHPSWIGLNMKILHACVCTGNLIQRLITSDKWIAIIE